MKKIMNEPEQIIHEMLDGLTSAYPEKMRRLEETTVIVRKDAPVEGKVGIVSGGGSGHEPAHAGFVGKGMLDAAVSGEVFTSPTPDQILEAIKAVDSGAGVLLVVKNYTGDVMNFDMAKELAEAEGIAVESVLVNDDVAVEDSSFTTGRRGVAGTVFVHKIAGAKAEEGASLEEVKQTAEHVVHNVRTMGVALSPCIMPTSGEPSFHLEDGEMELGIGIHGEPGVETKPLATADEIATALLDSVLSELEPVGNDQAAVMINGMGATPEMELYVFNRKVQELLAEKGVSVCRTFVGEYMTSLEMAGCSLTILKVDDDLKALLNAPSEAPAFRY
ncbi:dihydroxyacetone kinase subunit DhaK [Halobacillus sp. ACCC02827]|uniref:dihydroxyacetone kinase subunit DhaK n=1 Tax=Bacillaceae TaxID=186817 RepID=UPI00041E3CCB|nr:MULTISPECIES: dihydroxyacetone kinase subunit DhaK [Bacillaceae]QHT47780.1 dihydroxyacetone kinase subunit DhaK [Bacillus sp. SB49]WJE15022.1 dihydroxyacetone kinase subunit DhaK [Halobacillus sp. ACCC02827]